jgi:type I restriction enzyme S subunit
MSFHNEAKSNGPGVVTGRYGTIGEVFYESGPYWPLNTTLYVQEFKGNLPLFVFYFLQTLDFKKFSGKTSIPGVNRNELHRIRVSFPPLPEQRKIAQILGTWDEAIATTEKLIAALERRKQGLMQRLLTGQVRFGEFAGSEWRVIRVGDVARLVAGGTPSTRKQSYWNGDVPWMRSGDIHLKRIERVEGRISQEGLDNSSAELLPPNSVLVALAGQGKTRGSVAINKTELSTNQSVAAIIPDPTKLYYEYLFANLDFRYEELRQMSSGAGGRGGLNLKILKNIRLPKPSLPEQIRISDVLKLCDEQTKLLESQKQHLTIQKKGLMQRLLTGQVRVAG